MKLQNYFNDDLYNRNESTLSRLQLNNVTVFF